MHPNGYVLLLDFILPHTQHTHTHKRTDINTQAQKCPLSGGRGCISSAPVGEKSYYNGCRYCEFDQFEDVPCLTDDAAKAPVGGGRS